MRIAVEAASLVGRRTGVGELTGQLLARLVERDDLEVTAFALTLRGRSALHDAVRELGGSRVTVRARPLPARATRALWQRADLPPIEAWIGRHDLVWGPNFVVPPTRWAASVVTVHDLTPLRFPELCSRDTLAYPNLVERAVRRGAWVHAPSQAVADEVRAWLPRAEVRAVPNGIDHAAIPEPSRWPQLAECGRALAGAPRYALAVGTVEPRKDHPTMLAAFDRVAERFDDVHLVVAGPDGWGVSAYESALAAMANRDRVVRLGWVERRDLDALLAGAAMLVFPSRYEGFGLPPLDAMARGIPVVTTDLPVLAEVGGDATIRVPVGDADALAGAMGDLLASPERCAELAERGRRRARAFSWERAADGLVALFTEAVGAMRS
ncbi:MAG: glycosyltransferase family 4 protein [Acidimicrobiia bacterium]|nr:glycosyltransferase family 4 protein [Acidimicrobiia bacterium]